MNSGTGADGNAHHFGSDGQGLFSGFERPPAYTLSVAESAGIAPLLAVLAGAGVELTAEETADALWLALTGVGGRQEEASDAPWERLWRQAESARGQVQPPSAEGPFDPPPAPGPGSDLARDPAPGPSTSPSPVPPPGARQPLYALAGSTPGDAATPVRVPAVHGLPNALSVTRALRPLGRRVSSPHRHELDEAATAAATADSGGRLEVVLRPQRARWLDLVLAVDDCLSMRVWQDTVAELDRLLSTSGFFRSVRRCAFDPRGGTGVRDTVVVDGDRTVVLVVADGVGPPWRDGAAQRALAGWARKAHTAVLHPLPVRLWPGTALAARPMRVRSSGPVPRNHQLHAYDPHLPSRLAPRIELPVPVVELSGWSIRPWAALTASEGGTATLRVIDAAAPPPAAAQPEVPSAEAAPERRLLAFQETVSPEAYELAGHLAAVDPLTLPVMRVVQSAALPGSSLSCLSEVLLSGLMRVERPIGDLDVFGFDPEVRPLLRTVVLSTDAQATIDAVSDFIAPRLGRTHDFPALLASRTGTLELPPRATPFAEIPAREEPPQVPATTDAPEEPAGGLAPGRYEHPAVQYVAGVRTGGAGGDGPLSSGYLVAPYAVLTTVTHVLDHRPGRSAVPDCGVRVHPGLGGEGGGLGRWYTAEPIWWGGGAMLLRIKDPRWNPPAVPPVDWGRIDEESGSLRQVIGYVRDPSASFPEVSADAQFVPTLPGDHAVVEGNLIDVRPPEDGGRPGALVRPLPSGACPEGAPIFVGSRLSGLVTDRLPDGGILYGLYALPVWECAGDPQFRAHLTETSPAPEPPRRTRSRPSEWDTWPLPLDWLAARVPHAAPNLRTGGEQQVLWRLISAVGGPRTAYGAQALGGPGGAAVAAEFAAGRRADYSVVWWIEAEIADDFLANLSVRMRAELLSSGGFPARGATPDVDPLDWLRTHVGWLVVLDGARDPAEPLTAQLLELTSGQVLFVLPDGSDGSDEVHWPCPVVRVGPAPDLGARIRRFPPDSAAGRILDVLPWFAPEAPFFLLRPLVADEEELTSALAELADAGMVVVDADLEEVTVHADLRDPGGHGTGADARPNPATAGPELAVEALTAVFRQDEAVARPLLRHVAALAGSSSPANDTGPMSELFLGVADFLRWHGDPAGAVEWGERALSGGQVQWGSEDRYTRISLAAGAIEAGLDAFIRLSSATLHAYVEAGGHAQGGSLERLLGVLHRTRFRRGWVDFGIADDLAEARVVSEQALGADHPLTRSIAEAVRLAAEPPGSPLPDETA